MRTTTPGAMTDTNGAIAVDERLASEVESVRAALDRLVDERDDEVPAELVELAEQRREVEASVAEEARLRERLGALEDARARLAAGEWGQCEVCGEPIGDARLEVLPATARCRDHAATQGSRTTD